jgi:acetolactate synthase-1/2/3 large subunit
VPADQPNREAHPGGPARQARLEAWYGIPHRLDDLASTLRQARRPIALVGHSAVRAGAGGALGRFVDAWGVPVLTTPKAKGLLPETHPLWAGVIDMAGARCLEAFIGQADLLMSIGLDGAELIYDWRHSIATVHLDSVPNLDYVYESELDVVGDIGGCLEGVAGLAAAGSQPKWSETEVARHRTDWRNRILIQGTDGLAPSQVVLAAREVLPPHTLATCDSGSHKMIVGALWQTPQPARFAVSNGLSTMGYSVPAALSAKLLEPDRPVVAFTGDGGFAMIEAELGTAVDRQLPIIVLVFNDGSLDRILRKQVVQGYPPFGSTFGNPEFVKLSQAHGAVGYSVRTVDELQRSLAAALTAQGPIVIDAQINPDEYAIQFSA